VFNRFPIKNRALLAKWLHSSRRDNWKPTENSYICSRHFAGNCFRRYAGQTRLTEDAVPTLFDFPSHLVKPQTSRRVLRRCAASPPVVDVDCTPQSVCTSVCINETHNYALTSSPRAVKRRYDDMLQRQKLRCDVAAKRLKVARRRLFRQQKKISCMKDLLTALKSRTDMSSVDVLERCFGHIPAEMLKRKLHCSSKQSYSDDLRSFALTLHFYSAKAYDFIRKTFASALPHPSTLRSWCSAVDGRPGFTREAFEVPSR